MVPAFEELFLEVIAGSPGEHASHIEIFAEYVTHHVLREHAFGGLFIVQASGGVDVVISRIPTLARGVDPPLEPEGERLALSFFDANRLLLDQVLRAAAVFHGVLSGRQLDHFTVRAVHLRMKRKVRSQALGLRRIDVSQLVADHKRARGWIAVLICNPEGNIHRGPALEEDAGVVAKPDVLSPLAYVEADLGFALARVAAVELDDAVLQLESGETGVQRLGVEHA